jgi:peptidoglycan/LPS O-acetylase OafA/YrhL
MPIAVMIGALLATIALVLYISGGLMIVISGKVKQRNAILQIIAVASDASATICMMIQSRGLIPADFHGWIGYVALILMAIALGLVLRHRKAGIAPTPMRVYVAIALVFWIISYSLGFVKMG